MLAKFKFLRWSSRRSFVITVNWLLFLGCVSVVIFCNVWKQTVNLIEWHQVASPKPLNTTNFTMVMVSKKPKRPGFLIDTPGCTIADMKPFDKSVKPFWKASTPDECPVPILVLENGLLKYNTKSKVRKSAKCCIREIARISQTMDNHTSEADSLYSVNETCIPVSHGSNEGLELPEFMLTECTVKKSKKDSSKNGTDKIYDYLAAPPSPWNSKTSLQALQISEYWDHRREEGQKEMPPNVLILGMDSVSRLHFMRSLPLTRKYLLANDFVELKGYTRVGLNTFPNLMAAFGGFEDYNYPCWKGGDSTFDNCPFIWDQFSAHDYVTAHVEDFTYMSTFNYMKSGFVDPPTDYYFRPMGLAYRSDDFRPFEDCVNGGTELEFVLQYIKNLQRSIAGRVPFLMISWMNQAHDYLDTLKKFDLVLRNAVRSSVETQGIGADNTIIFFISDHGLRFGRFRETSLGYFEESLPMFFVRLPETIKKRFPEWQRHLADNGGKLLSPLDFHATLQHIAESGRGVASSPIEREVGRRKYYSFFGNVPNNRTCKEAGISSEYCRCGFRPGASKKKKVAKATANVVTGALNSLLDYEIGTGLCVSVKYRKLLYLRDLAGGQTNGTSDEEPVTYSDTLIGFETDPVGARFEATLRYFSGIEAPEVQGEVRRIDSYKGQSDCTEDVKLKNYCICRDYVEKLGKKGDMPAENLSEST